MPEDDLHGLKKDIVASQNPAGHDHSRKSLDRRVYPLDEKFRLNVHMDNSILSRIIMNKIMIRTRIIVSTRIIMKKIVGKGRRAYSNFVTDLISGSSIERRLQKPLKPEPIGIATAQFLEESYRILKNQFQSLGSLT